VRYLLLIYGDETAEAKLSPAEQEADMAAWFAYTEELERAGKHLSGAALMPTATATVVRGTEGHPLVSDGPFAETKEQFGGSYLIEAADLDEAIAWSAKMPHVPRGGAVEVRPIMEVGAA
jgi:hypothetical protein